MKRNCKRIVSLTLTGAIVAGLAGCGSTPAASSASAASTAQAPGSTAAAPVTANPLDPSSPTTITVWNYYNGDQLAAFDALVSEFNSTVGLEEGIAVVSVSQSSVNNVADGLLAAAAGKIGAQDLPNLAAIYAETAYILDAQDLLVDLDAYFTPEELAAYIPGFVQEGRLTEDGPLLLVPVMKSTECFAANATDWSAFETATGVTIDSITSYETLTETAQKYYEWTDELTPEVAEDGKALYGRDSIANYIYIGTTQLGHEMFRVATDGAVTVDLDRDTFKTLWDNYYIPFINGYFAAQASYRSEDMKTGAILAMTGSTSGVSYLPTTVTDENEASHDIQITVKNPLNFRAGSKIAVQQGADYCVLRSTDAAQYASAEFLKWLTDPDRNLAFSASSGYSPVTVAANNADAITASFAGKETSVKDQNMLQALLVSADVYTNEDTYTSKPFAGSKELRDVLETTLINTCAEDRAAVQEAIAAGQSRADAVAPYATDEYFDAWFTALCDSVNAVVG